MTGRSRLVNLNGKQAIVRGLFQITIPEFSQRDSTKSRKASVRIVGVRAKILAGHLTNTRQKLYSLNEHPQ
jgi:hypothetical protein